MLTSRPPFQASEPLETLRQILDDEPPRLRRLNSQIAPELETICLKCLRKDLKEALRLSDGPRRAALKARLLKLQTDQSSRKIE